MRSITRKTSPSSDLDLSGFLGAQPLSWLCFFAQWQRRPARQGKKALGNRRDTLGGTPTEKVRGRDVEDAAPKNPKVKGRGWAWW